MTGSERIDLHKSKPKKLHKLDLERSAESWLKKGAVEKNCTNSQWLLVQFFSPPPC